MQRLHAYRPVRHPPHPAKEDVACAYDEAGGDYLAYADGDPVAPLPIDIDVVPGALTVFA